MKYVVVFGADGPDGRTSAIDSPLIHSPAVAAAYARMQVGRRLADVLALPGCEETWSGPGWDDDLPVAGWSVYAYDELEGVTIDAPVAESVS